MMFIEIYLFLWTQLLLVLICQLEANKYVPSYLIAQGCTFVDASSNCITVPELVDFANCKANLNAFR